MLDNLKEKLVCEMKDISKDGVKTGNIEYIAKLAETYKNLNKAEKEELETMIYDDRMNNDRRYSDYDRRSYGGRYHDDMRFGDHRGRGEYANRDSRGRYADAIRPIDDGYSDYVGAKRRYRAGGDSKEQMYDGLELLMKHLTLLIEDLYRDCDGEEERRIMNKHLEKLSHLR